MIFVTVYPPADVNLNDVYDQATHMLVWKVATL